MGNADDLHVHQSGEVHHHHSHADDSRHEGGHHLLQVSHLSVTFTMYDDDGSYFAAEQKESAPLRDLSISVHAGEVIAVVGASGSGKTLLADSVMGIFQPNSRVTGQIWFDGEPMDETSLAHVRGKPGGIALVPQGVSHLDPLMRVGKQVEGCVRGRDAMLRREKRERLFARYGLGAQVARMYPHELSGGMARRVLLCCALMDDPALIVADEPTPGLDLDLAIAAVADFRDFADAGGAVLFITHDIELALRVADRVAVFKDGTVVEETSVESFLSPETLSHPYSRQLWHAMPEHGFSTGRAAGLDGISNREGRALC